MQKSLSVNLEELVNTEAKVKILERLLLLKYV